MMDPSRLLSLLFWSHLFLTAFADSFLQENPPEVFTPGIVRRIRRSSSRDMIDSIINRMNTIEHGVTRTTDAVEQLRDYLKVIGMIPSAATKETVDKSQNPCPNILQCPDCQQDANEMPWTFFGNSKCVKFISKLSTFANATELCRQQYIKGEDISHPVVLSVDSSTNSTSSLVSLLHGQDGMSSVWVNQKDSFEASNQLNCSELRVSEENATTPNVQLRNVDCGRLNRVVCEKPAVISYVGMVQRQLATEAEDHLLRDEMKQLMNNFQDKVAQVQKESAEKQAILQVDVKRLEGKLAETSVRLSNLEKSSMNRSKAGGLFASEGRLEEANRTAGDGEISPAQQKIILGTPEVFRLTQSNVTMDGEMSQFGSLTEESLGKPQTAIENIDTILVSKEWELGGLDSFETYKATGNWFWIEGFYPSRPFTTSYTCSEYVFNFTGPATIATTIRYQISGENKEGTYDLTVDAPFPHLWINSNSGSWVNTWLKTDYNNWGILLSCSNKEISSCHILLILSRTRTLSPDILEMLRNVAEERGFPKAYGGVHNQTSC